MMPDIRPVVRHRDEFSGRWRIAGTTCFVANIQADFQADPDEARSQYRQVGLIDEEIDAALAFDFPTFRPVLIEPTFVAYRIHCECGEFRDTHVVPPLFQATPCICGRVWRIPVGIEQVRDGKTKEISAT